MSATRRIGDVSQAMVIAAFVSKGFKVALPWSDDARYDLIVDDDKTLRRVQVKTAHLIENGDALSFRACSSLSHHRTKGQPPTERRLGYHGQIEAFAVYLPVLSTVYLIPIEHVVSTSEMRLRITPAKNAQRIGVNTAEDFVFHRFMPS